MAIFLPERCPRGFGPEVCQPLNQILVDEKAPGVAAGFICCGHLAQAARALLQDRFRVCFRGATTDTMFDHDERDMVDTIAVMMGGLSADHNRRASGEPEAAWNETPATAPAGEERDGR